MPSAGWEDDGDSEIKLNVPQGGSSPLKLGGIGNKPKEPEIKNTVKAPKISQKIQKEEDTTLLTEEESENEN